MGESPIHGAQSNGSSNGARDDLRIRVLQRNITENPDADIAPVYNGCPYNT